MAGGPGPEPDPEASARARLAAAEAGLMRALAGSAPAPEGFDAGRVRAAAGSLASKRARSVARAWPALARALGEGFAARFADFAAETTLPGLGGPLADGRAFARSLARRGGVSLTDDARVEVMAVDLRYRRAGRDGSLAPRRGPSVVAARLGGSRRWVVAVRAPGLGERWASGGGWGMGNRG